MSKRLYVFVVSTYAHRFLGSNFIVNHFDDIDSSSSLHQWTLVGRQLEAFRMVVPATSCRCFQRGTKIWMPPSILQVGSIYTRI